MPDRYQNLDGGMAYTLEKEKARRKKSMLMVLFSIFVLLLLVGGGIVTWYLLSHRIKSSGSSGSRLDVGSDPSQFEQDQRLHKSFYGIAYTPEGALMPNCGAQLGVLPSWYGMDCQYVTLKTSFLENIIKDVQLMSQLTSRIRLYGADCNQTALVLEAIKQTKVDMQVYVGNYVVSDDIAVYQRQRDAIKDALQTYGTDHVAGITVGNEFMLNYLTGHSSQNPESSTGRQGATILKADIDDTRQMIADLQLSKAVQIGNSDAGSFFSKEVLEDVNYGMSNVHPWFANTTAEAAAPWVFKFFDETNVQPASQLPNKPKMYIAETGWPTKSSDAGNENSGGSDASVASLQIFLDNFVCQANQNGIGYFFFEFCDEKWKDDAYGGVEGWWGLFNGDRTLKDLKIPDCPAL